MDLRPPGSTAFRPSTPGCRSPTRRLDPTAFATHRFELDEAMEAYDVFADAAATNALKVVLAAHPVHVEAGRPAVAATA